MPTKLRPVGTAVPWSAVMLVGGGAALLLFALAEFGRWMG